MSTMDTLISFGRGYATIGAITSALIGAVVIWVGRSLPAKEGDNVAKNATIAGVIIIVLGVGLAYLAQENDSVAMVYGVLFVLLILATIIAMFKGGSTSKKD